MPWPGDLIPTREIPLGTIGTKYPEAHPVCVVCGCDVTDFRFEMFGFAGHPMHEYILIVTCLDHWREPLEARLRAAA